jgi:type VI protein secretion system component VasK
MRTDFLTTVKRFSWQQWVVVILFVVVASFTTYRAVHTVRRIAYWQTHRDEPIRGWMTVGFVAHSYRVPAHVLYDALGLPDKPRDKRPLREIAKTQHRSIEEVRAILQETITQARAAGPPSQPPDHGGSR